MEKRNFILIIELACLISIFAGCEIVSHNEQVDKNITHVETIPGGCNSQDFPDLKSEMDEYQDTIIFTVKNDTLDLFVGLNYICCAPFISDATASNDSILLTITDTCPNPYHDCYCRCMCYYTWNFIFSDIDEKDYFLKIILSDPREEGPVIISDGPIHPEE